MMSLSTHSTRINAGAPTLLLAALTLAFAAPTRTADTAAVLQDDRAFIQACEQKNSALTSKLLSPDFVWINSTGKRFRRADALSQFPAIANADVAPEARIYGNFAVGRSDQGKMHVLPVWVKRPDGWGILLYQELKQVEKSEPASGEPSGECRNPCKEIPLQPKTPAEKAAIASWQGVMKAMAESDAAAYSPLIADEF